MGSMSGLCRFSTTDPDHVYEILHRNGWGDHTRVIKQRGAFLYQATAARTRHLLVGRLETRLTQVVHATAPVPALYVPLAGEGSCRIGRRNLSASPGRAIFLAAGHEYSLSYAGGTWLSFSIAPDFLSTLVSPDGSASGERRSVLSGELSLTRGTWRGLIRAALPLLKPVTAGQTARNDKWIERELGRWLGAHLAGTSPAIAISARQRRRLEVMRTWIDRNFKEQITLERLAGALGVSKRSLQYLCVSGFGMTPMEVVQWRRLAAVRRALERAGPDTTVTKTALENGFTHLGRFSKAYSEVYGELPSETLASSRIGRVWSMTPHRRILPSPAQPWVNRRLEALDRLQLSPPGLKSSRTG